mmetsp:Transcript_33561/g.69205  ORF Transcript_33561/g.69205 Transcript_33561/m.69205 type:complete len:205 (+) Transcript_33561:233-847(+)
MPPTAAAQHRLSKAASHGAQGLLVIEAGLLKCSEGIGRQNLGPFVRVVSGSIATSKDVAKGAQEAIFLERRQDLVLGSQSPLHIQEGFCSVWIILRMKLHVQIPELQLPKHHGGGHEDAAAFDLLEDVCRKWFPGFVVHRKRIHSWLVVQPVLHELRGKLHRIPLDVVDASTVTILHMSQHVLETVAELMEQGLSLGERHQRWL